MKRHGALMIRYVPNVSLLTIEPFMAEEASAREVAKLHASMQLFDPKCHVGGNTVIFSPGTQPQDLACFLLDMDLIGKECFREIQADMTRWRGGRENGGRGA